MNTATDPAFNPRLVARFATFHAPLGRWRLRWHLRWKYLLWRQLIGGTHAAKRGLDILASSCALFLLSPLFLFVALLIKFEDHGPVVFSQVRVGRFGRGFKMYKFRSMRPGSEARLKELLDKNHHNLGVTFKIKDDPRITRVGRWLRKYSFDELPQLFNVLIGDMSLVGPRPPLPREVALYSLADRRRLAVKPGITCIWQISGRAEIDFPGQVRLDVQYIESQSLWQDIKILGKTIPAVLSGTGAY
jgi:lipopolysaccharide/colanic/teichoic acid biosynthesis glycosyltransferase